MGSACIRNQTIFQAEIHTGASSMGEAIDDLAKVLGIIGLIFGTLLVTIPRCNFLHTLIDNLNLDSNHEVCLHETLELRDLPGSNADQNQTATITVMNNQKRSCACATSDFSLLPAHNLSFHRWLIFKQFLMIILVFCQIGLRTQWSSCPEPFPPKI